MGNLQANEAKHPSKAGKSPTSKVKTLMKIRGKNKGKESPQLTSEIEESQEIIKEVPPPRNGVSSSSESNFTDALTPMGFTTESQKCYSEENVNLDVQVPNSHQENFFNLTLNNFKLNEYRVRHEEERSKKLSKLGVSRTSQISLESDPNDCFSFGNVEIVSKIDDEGRDSGTLKRKSQDYGNEFSFSEGHPEYKRHLSTPAETTDAPERLVLKKVASLTLGRIELENRIFKPKFVPEKLDFRLYEKFEGHMLANWLVSEFNEDNLLNTQDLKLFAIQFCTHLLAAGVIMQIPDKDVPMHNIFKPDCMYYWAHAEQTAASVPQTPGRLSMVSWPPMSPSEVFLSANEVITSPPSELSYHRDDTSAQQSFKSSARDVEILSLEDEIQRLKQEVEKYKTYIEIQNLTAKTVQDFSSPIEEDKCICDNRIDKYVQTDNKFNGSAQHSSIATQTHLQHTNDKSTSTEIPPETIPPSPPPVLQMAPLPPPMPGMGPPPPPMPGMGPPPPPMPGMGPPPPPMPGLGPPPPPPMIPGMSPPPPPMPGMGPPPPPMPGLGPPPPPMPGLGPAPPPMPGMIPPPPPVVIHAPSCGPPPPPPPGGGPISLPAPPTGGWNSHKAALRKSAVTPSAPMKPLYWTRILAATIPDSTTEVSTTDPALWTQIDELPMENLNEFTDLFSRQVVARKPIVKKLQQKVKVGAVKLLDSKRSQNVGILAQSLHLDFQEIENAIYNFDTSIVSLEALQQIYEARATTEELDLIRSHLATKPDFPLDKPEQFLFELSEISNFAERISCLMFQVEFDDSINTIDHILTNIKTTCEYLMNSKELKEVFSIILTLGNYMNGGNMTRGQADGFGLEILSKLKDVKSKDSKITLLHYIVRVYMKKIENPFESNIILPIPEPGDMERAASVNFDNVQVDLKKLEKQLDNCQRKTNKVIEESTPENLQPFKDKMLSFLDYSRKQLANEFEILDECRVKFVNTMKFYLFKPKSGNLETHPPNSFFELWLPFCTDFKDIFKKELIRMENEKIMEIKKKEHERLKENVKVKMHENGLKSKVKKWKAKHT